jgi:hypothetical protein
MTRRKGKVQHPQDPTAGSVSNRFNSPIKYSPHFTVFPSFSRIKYGFPDVDDLLAAFSIKSRAVTISFACVSHFRRRNFAAEPESYSLPFRMNFAYFNPSTMRINPSIFSFSVSGFAIAEKLQPISATIAPAAAVRNEDAFIRSATRSQSPASMKQ